MLLSSYRVASPSTFEGTVRGSRVDPGPAIMAVEVEKLRASDAGLSDAFGRAVAIDGDTVLVGADTESMLGLLNGCTCPSAYGRGSSAPRTSARSSAWISLVIRHAPNDKDRRTMSIEAASLEPASSRPCLRPPPRPPAEQGRGIP